MTTELSPAMQHAVHELEGMVLQHYPDAQFTVGPSPDEPNIVHVNATVDTDDMDAVFDVVVDRIMEMQINDGLLVYVIPFRTRERMLAEIQRQEEAQRQRESGAVLPDVG